nr:hypothetical protein Cry52Nrm2_p109 [Cryptomonas curvata]
MLICLLNFHMTNFLKYTNKKVNFLLLRKKYFTLAYINLPSIHSLVIINGNGGNGGKINFKKLMEPNDDFNYFFLIALCLLPFFILIQLRFISKEYKKYDEIVLKNCELIPSSFFCNFFTVLLKEKVSNIHVLKIMISSNQWYLDRNYIFSSFKNKKNINTGNIFQLCFFGCEPKIKNIIKSKKTKTKISIISRALGIISGNHFKWYSSAWIEFCNCKNFEGANFSTKLLISKDENVFIDLYIDFKEENSLIVNPGIAIENNNLTGIISTEKKNILGKNINFKSTLVKNHFNVFYLKLEIKKLIHPTFNLSIFFENLSRNYKEKILKIVKVFGINLKDKIEIVMSYPDKNNIFFQKRNFFFSNVLIGYSREKKTGHNLNILPYFYLTFSKNNNYLPFVNFDIRLFLSSKTPFLSKKKLRPIMNFKYILKIRNYITNFKNFLLIVSQQNIYSSNIILNSPKIPVGFYFDFNSLMSRNFKFFFYVDLYKNLEKNKIIGKSIGVGFKFNNILNLSSVITSDGCLKIVIGTS